MILGLIFIQYRKLREPTWKTKMNNTKNGVILASHKDLILETPNRQARDEL